MRHLMCTCLKCGGQNNMSFDEPYPQYGEQFVRYCRHCGEDTAQTMTLTKKVATELRKQKAEEELQQSIIDYCKKHGFTCRFLYESVIVTTPISSWQFAYHESKKTLRHESTTKINFDTGDYAFTHEQFRDKKMSCEEVIYDNGQTQVTKIITSVFNTLFANVEMRKVRPVDYKLFQVADLICTLEMIHGVVVPNVSGTDGKVSTCKNLSAVLLFKF